MEVPPELTEKELEQFLAAIEVGIQELDRGETVPHEEVVKNLEREFGFKIPRKQQSD